MSRSRLVVVTVPPGPNPWQLFFADSVGAGDDMSFVCELRDWPAMTASECAAIEDMLFLEHRVVLTSPWRYEIEWWDADIEAVREPCDGATQFRRHFAYRTIPEREGDRVTVSLMHRPVHADGMPMTERLFTHEIDSTISIDQRLRESGATVASEWVEVAGGSFDASARCTRPRLPGRGFPPFLNSPCD